MLEKIALDIAVSLLKSIIATGYKKITRNHYTDYEIKLKEVILKSVDEYQKLYPINETDKIPFYSSMVVFEELLKYRFTSSLDVGKLKTAIEKDPRIIVPTDEQLIKFFEIFNHQISQSPTLKDLNIEFHYKEEIFSISEKLTETRDTILSTIHDLKKELENLETTKVITDEWSKQLDEIFEDLKKFKVITAQQRLNTLEQRITEAGFEKNKKLFSRIYYLQAVCLEQMGDKDNGTKAAELLIKAYKANPKNIEYKEYAALGYHILEDNKTATLLAEEVLMVDPFNARGWALKCFDAKEKFQDVLKEVPTTVRDKNGFVVQMFLWLNSMKYVQSTEDFKKLGLDFEIDIEKEPDEINLNNKIRSLILVGYLLSEFYEKEKTLSAVLKIPDSKNNKRYLFANRLLKKLKSTLKGTEIEKFHQPYFFQYCCTNLILTEDISNVGEMEQEFKKLQNKSHDNIIRMAQAYNNLNTEEGTRLAIETLELLKDEPTELSLVLTFLNYSIIGDSQETEKYVLKYLELHPYITTEAFLNIAKGLRSGAIPKTDSIKNKLITLSNNSEGDRKINRLLKVVLYMLWETGFDSEEEIYDELQSIEGELEEAIEEIYIHVAFGYAQIGKFSEGIRLLKDKVSFDHPSESYKLYCKILFKSEGNKPELLAHLKKWRIELNAGDPELLDMEAYFAQLNKNWKELATIAKFAIESLGKSPHFLYLYFAALGEDQNIAEINKNASLLDGIEFKEENYGIAVAMSLIKAGLFQRALDLLYNQARKRNNIKSRQSLLMLSVHFPPDLLKELSEVNIGCIVKYELNGETRLISITKENHHDFPQTVLMGKKTGDAFSFTAKLGATIQNGRIIRICDKYLGLFEEIMQDASNPMSGMDILAMKFSDNSAEGMMKTFIEHFGVQGTLEQESLEQSWEEYYSGNISFSEITMRVFRKNPFDAYYALSSPSSKQFKAISPIISNHVVIAENSRLVLDPTSVCLLYELSTKYHILYERKFIVSSFIRTILNGLISDTRNSPPSKMSLTIRYDKVYPHIYPDDFNTKLIEHYEQIAIWLDNNCEVVEIPERFNFIMNLSEEEKNSSYLQLIIENKLLADRENHLLVTDDTMYYRHLHCSPSNVVGSQLYLYQCHNDKEMQIKEHLLEHNYIGLPISAGILKEELLKFLSGKENRFPICLENLKHNWNPDINSIYEAVKFIKSLYLDVFIDREARQRIVTSIFGNLIIGLPPVNRKDLFRLVAVEFKLLPLQKVEVMDILTKII